MTELSHTSQCMHEWGRGKKECCFSAVLRMWETPVMVAVCRRGKILSQERFDRISSRDPSKKKKKDDFETIFLQKPKTNPEY